LSVWQQFPPLFERRKIKITDLDANMGQYALDNKLMGANTEREALVPCLEVENTVITTRLLKFYLDNSVVDYKDVQFVLEFRQANVFKKFRDDLIQQRMEVFTILFITICVGRERW